MVNQEIPILLKLKRFVRDSYAELDCQNLTKVVNFVMRLHE